MVPEPDSSPPDHKSGHRLLDIIIGASALFISLCSLGLAIHSGRAMDRLVEANSRPVLVLESGNVDPEQPRGTVHQELYVAVENPGAGNAHVEWAQLEVGGHEVHSWGDALKVVRDQAVAAGSLPAETPVPDDFVISTFTHLYVKPGSSRLLFTWPRTEENDALWKAAARARDASAFRLSACYCSIFDQCWVVRSGGEAPAPVASCAVGRPKTRGAPL